LSPRDSESCSNTGGCGARPPACTSASTAVLLMKFAQECRTYKGPSSNGRHAAARTRPRAWPSGVGARTQPNVVSRLPPPVAVRALTSSICVAVQLAGPLQGRRPRRRRSKAPCRRLHRLSVSHGSPRTAAVGQQQRAPATPSHSPACVPSAVLLLPSPAHASRTAWRRRAAQQNHGASRGDAHTLPCRQPLPALPTTAPPRTFALVAFPVWAVSCATTGGRCCKLAPSQISSKFSDFVPKIWTPCLLGFEKILRV